MLNKKHYKATTYSGEIMISTQEGKDACTCVHPADVPEPDVAAIRAHAGLSQAEFARSIDVAVGTLQGWEQGPRRPAARRGDGNASLNTFQ